METGLIAAGPWARKNGNNRGLGAGGLGLPVTSSESSWATSSLSASFSSLKSGDNTIAVRLLKELDKIYKEIK